MNLNELLLGVGSEFRWPLNDSIDKDTSFLVSGGAGSIGRELTSQLLENGAHNIWVFDNSKQRLEGFDNSIPQSFTNRIHFLLGDVSSRSDLEKAISISRPDCVFHFAALKHVDRAECDADRTFEINVEGTFNILRAAADARRFMLMSTDKAVFPAGIMGATKRLAELAVMFYAERNPSCEYSIIRSGNVIGTSGSALDKFVCQVENSREVTVTHREMERFFISNAELTSLIICAVLGKRERRSGATSYIVDCGRPLRIVDVVRRIANHVGKRIVENNPGTKELVIELVGVRAGEKLKEKMHQSSNFDNTDMEKLKIGLDDGFVSTLRELPKEFRFLQGSSSLCVDDLVSRFYRLLDVDS